MSKNKFMPELSQTEENYLKAIYKLHEQSAKSASTNAIADILSTSAASVTDMLKKLADKNLVHYQKYKGAKLTDTGKSTATSLVRKHRLWEVFLIEKLNFKWDEVHDIAEQLEHVQSDKLVDELDDFLDNPKYDPHGDPIPDKQGRFKLRQQVLLHQLEIGESGVLVGVREQNKLFLNHLDDLQLKIGSQIRINGINAYDEMLEIEVDNQRKEKISKKVSEKIFVQKS